MNARIRHLLDRISALEQELSTALRWQYCLVGSRVEFTDAVRDAHRNVKTHLARWLLQSRPQSLLSIPFIYGMAVPLLVLDLSISLYQAICFPLYGIGKVRRREYFVIDRHRLAYLNALEKAHCAYCSYATGLLGYAREITARTEQYWCPIRHSRPMAGAHAHYARFLEYGDATDFHARAEQLRDQLAETKVVENPPSAG